MDKRKEAIIMIAGLFLTAGMAQGVILAEDLASAPNAGPNGWNPVVSNDPDSGRSNDEGGKLQIRTLGDNTSISYTQPGAAPYATTQWMNAELIASISASDAPAPNEAGLGVSMIIGNNTFQYVMGLTAADAGGGFVDIELVALNTAGPPPISHLNSYTFQSTGPAQHRYNAEVEGANLAFYVDTTPVFTVPIASLNGGPGPFLQFGDNRSGPDATGDIYNVRFSDGDVLVPEPGVAGLFLLGAMVAFWRKRR